jgi:hypothetical protein
MTFWVRVFQLSKSIIALTMEIEMHTVIMKNQTLDPNGQS